MNVLSMAAILLFCLFRVSLQFILYIIDVYVSESTYGIG